jgi:Leucine-rich repeat (LRR) protein
LCRCVIPWAQATCFGQRGATLRYIPKLPHWVSVLLLVGFQLTSRQLETLSFANVTQVTSLSLQDNRLTDLKAGWFREMNNLTRLDLTNNPIHSFHVRANLSTFIQILVDVVEYECEFCV